MKADTVCIFAAQVPAPIMVPDTREVFSEYLGKGVRKERRDKRWEESRENEEEKRKRRANGGGKEEEKEGKKRRERRKPIYGK